MITNEPINGALAIRELDFEPRFDRPASPIQAPRRSPWRLWLGAGLALFALAVFCNLRSRQQAEARLQDTADRSAVPSVNVTSPKAGAIVGEIALPGNTLAYNDTSIYARTSGYVKNWYADIGARVRAGDLLAEIEVPELDQQLHQAEADLATAQASLELAKVTNTRWQELLSHRVISPQEADQVKSDLGVKQAACAASGANVRRLQEMQKYERVVAPFDAIVTARGVDIGALVDPAAGSAAHELFHLAAVQKLRVYVAVPEIYADGIRDGVEVTISQTSNAVRAFKGVIVRNSNAIDQASRTLNVEVEVDNADGRLLPGAYVFVHLKLPAEANSVSIPSNALLFRTEGLRAAKVVDGKVSLTPITIGHDFGSTVEITSGLSPQDAVILDPSDSLADGAKVAVNEASKTLAGR
jgi:RND family efflux transporter MFP subunit